ncbi:MAG: Gfo/Idh/MocA family oxidoreductase [Cytophagaceae bacterium]|nr:Gfo/Idh/MocA family oxidoreductase [Cytophagaceae bacterium]
MKIIDSYSDQENYASAIGATTRRDFLNQTALFGALAVFSPHVLLAATRPQKDRLGIALVGLGYYSTDVLAPAFAYTKNCYLAGVVTGTPAKAEAWKKKYNLADKNIYNYQTFDQIANNPDIDVVYVVLPPSMHREYVERAAKAGKQVWCEKPMAPTVADCQAMIAACKKNKVALAIGYRCQHDPNVQEYMRLGRGKVFGEIKSVESVAGYTEGRTDHWKQKRAMGGGVMGDMGVYAIQGARLITGEEPVAVTAKLYTNRPRIYTEVEEIADYTLEFPSGITAKCHSSYGDNQNFLRATCEKGEIYVAPQQGYNGIKGRSPQGDWHFPIKNQQALQMDDDALAILQKKPLIAPGEEGLRDIRVMEAVYRAGKSGKKETV